MKYQMRKSGREITDLNEIKVILDSCRILRIAFQTNDYPYIVPVNFGYTLEDEKWTFYFHSAKEGRKIDLIRNEPQVGFETDRLIQTGTSEKPCGWTSFFESIIGEGTIFFTDGDEKKKGMDVIMRHHGFTGPIEYDLHSFELAEILKIKVTTLAAKRNLPKVN